MFTRNFINLFQPEIYRFAADNECIFSISYTLLREKSTQIINFVVETEIRKMQDILLATFYF